MYEKQFHIFRSQVTGEYYFRLLALGNDKTIAASEGYHNHADVMALHEHYFSDWEIEDESGWEPDQAHDDRAGGVAGADEGTEADPGTEA